MFTSVLHHLFSIKRFSLGLGAIGIGGIVTHYGIIKPAINSKNYQILEGSQALMGRKKETGLSFNKNFYYVNDLNQPIPNLFPALITQHLKDMNKNDFNRDIHKYLDLKPIEKNIRDADYKDLKDGFLLRHQKTLQENISTNLFLMSDIEIPYKAASLINKVNKFDKSSIIQDILWSLAEESAFNKTSIRPDSIIINFELHKHGVESSLDSFPYPANKIDNFFLSFKIFNPNNEQTTVFKSIPVDPISEVEVVINLSKAEIRPFAKPVNATGYKAISWNLVPKANSLWEVKVKKIFPYVEYKNYTFKDLSLIHGRSKFIPYTISKNNVSLVSLNSPTYQDFKEVASPYLMNITSNIIEKDLETWYGSVAARQLSLMIEDFESLINMINKKVFVDNLGKSTSLFKRFVEDVHFRKNFYIKSRFDLKTSQVVDLFFDSQKNKNAITLKDLEILLSVWKKVFEDVRDTIKIEFIWKQKPVVGGALKDDNSPFPSVSFEFEQKISWTKKIVFPFKGKWNEKDNCFSYGQANGQEIVGFCSNNNSNNNFDFTKKLSNPKILFTPIKKVISSLGSPLGVDIFNVLIPDAKNFVNWDKWEIEKDEYIVVNYKAKESPIRPSLTDNFDKRDEINGEVVLGWKALDISSTYDFSNFHSFFYKLYEKVDNKLLDDFSIGVSTIGSIPSELKKRPMSLISHLINELFKQKELKELKPWRTFFKSLLSKPFTFPSIQLFAGYSRVFFDVEPWVLSNNSKEFKTNSTWNSTWNSTFPAKPKYSDIANIVNTMQIYYSTFFPRPLLIFKFDNSPQYKQFINTIGSTSIGLTKGIDKLKEVLQNSYHYEIGHEEKKNWLKSFPKRDLIDWNKAKITYVQLELQKAIKSVLSMKPNLSWTVSTALNVFSVVIPKLLGEALQRDGFWVNVNMMMEDISIAVILFPTTRNVSNSYSVHSWFLEPKLDPNKLELGNLKGLLGLKK